jgi:Xaa-Pro aminopeptidase
MVKYHKAVIKRIRPGVTANQIMEAAGAEMEEVLKNTKFSKPIYQKAARSTYGHMSHTVGMSVHDVGSSRGPLKPGMVFAVDPQMRVPEENLYIRIEDTVLVTEDGVEILTGSAPRELDDVEKLMKEKGILQKYPPVFAAKKKP